MLIIAKLQPVSKLAGHDFYAAEPEHAKEIIDVVLPARDQAAKPLQPGKETFEGPAPPVAAQRTAILRGVPPVTAVRRDHLHPVLFPHLTIQRIAVVGLVPDQSCRQVVEEAVVNGYFDKLAFVRRSSLETDSERNTVASGDSPDPGHAERLPVLQNGQDRPSLSASAAPVNQRLRETEISRRRWTGLTVRCSNPAPPELPCN